MASNVRFQMKCVISMMVSANAEWGTHVKISHGLQHVMFSVVPVHVVANIHAIMELNHATKSVVPVLITRVRNRTKIYECFSF